MPVLFYIGNDQRPCKGYAPHTFPRGEGMRAVDDRPYKRNILW